MATCRSCLYSGVHWPSINKKVDDGENEKAACRYAHAIGGARREQGKVAVGGARENVKRSKSSIQAFNVQLCKWRPA